MFFDNFVLLSLKQRVPCHYAKWGPKAVKIDWNNFLFSVGGEAISRGDGSMDNLSARVSIKKPL